MSQNLAAVDLSLDPAVIDELDQASAFDLGHPYHMVEREMPMALAYGGMFGSIDIPNFPGRRPPFRA